MTVNYIIDLLKDCEYIKGYEMGIGFLRDRVNSVSIVPDGDEEIIRNYIDGAKIKGYKFSLLIRMNADFCDNSNNFLKLEKICDWLSSLSPDNLKSMTDGVPLGIKIIKSGTLSDDNIHSLKYEIKCRFDYLQEQENAYENNEKK